MRFLCCLAVLLCLLAPASARDDGPLALVQKAIKAAGGQQAVARLHAVSWRMKLTAPDAASPFYSDESSAQGLDQYRAVVEIEEGGRTYQAIQVANRGKGWFHTQGKTITAPRDFLGPRMACYYILRLPELLLPLKEKASRLSHLGEIRVAGRLAVGVRVERAGQVDVNIYFDKETMLFVRSEARLKLPDDREIVVAFQVSDYKEFDGLKHFTRFIFEVEQEKQFEAELTDLRALGKIDDSVFGKP